MGGWKIADLVSLPIYSRHIYNWILQDPEACAKWQTFRACSSSQPQLHWPQLDPLITSLILPEQHSHQAIQTTITTQHHQKVFTAPRTSTHPTPPLFLQQPESPTAILSTPSTIYPIYPIAAKTILDPFLKISFSGVYISTEMATIIADYTLSSR